MQGKEIITPKPTRTADPLLRRQLLYPLSYRGPVADDIYAGRRRQVEHKRRIGITCRP